MSTPEHPKARDGAASTGESRTRSHHGTTARVSPMFLLRSFNFREPKIRVEAGEDEVADYLIIVENIRIIIQHKARIPQAAQTFATEEKWFKKKVLQVAIGQIRDSLKHLNSSDSHVLSNAAGETVTLERGAMDTAEKVVIYRPSSRLPIQYSMLKYKQSRRCGFVHLVSEPVFRYLVSYLITPYELFEYLEFRRKVIEAFGEVTNQYCEQDILAMYIRSDNVEEPNFTHSHILDEILHDPNVRGMLRFLALAESRLAGAIALADDHDGDEHHKILARFAALDRVGLGILAQMFLWAEELMQRRTGDLPRRYFDHRTSTCFVFFPLDSKEHDDRRKYLEVATRLAKYSVRAVHALGLTFSREFDDSFGYVIEWGLLSGQWEPCEELDLRLEKAQAEGLFLSQPQRRIPRYPVPGEAPLSEGDEKGPI